MLTPASLVVFAWLHAGVDRPRSQAPRLVLKPPLVDVREAEANFVDHENLEPGETLVRALKAFDDDGNFLCAGALLARHSESRGRTVHDCWLADSIETGVGPNVQIRGAVAVLDALLLVHLSSDVTSFALHAGSGRGTTAAAHAAGHGCRRAVLAAAG